MQFLAPGPIGSGILSGIHQCLVFQARQTEFASRLDLELLKQQIEHQAFDRETFVQVKSRLRSETLALLIPKHHGNSV